MNTDRLSERQRVANLLIWQSALRIAGLMNLGAISSVRRALETYLLCSQRGLECLHTLQPGNKQEKWVIAHIDMASEYVERSWQDFRNNLQILLLTQDEALMWLAKIEKTLSNR